MMERHNPTYVMISRIVTSLDESYGKVKMNSGLIDPTHLSRRRKLQQE